VDGWPYEPRPPKLSRYAEIVTQEIETLGGSTMDKAILLQPRDASTEHGMPEDDVEVPGLGTVRVRALSRKEALKTGQIADIEERTAHMIAIAMVDPKMSVSEVKGWSAVALAGELDPVDEKIAELSGMNTDAAKAAYKSDGSGPESGVRSLPGGQAGDDGDGAAGADA